MSAKKPKTPPPLSPKKKAFASTLAGLPNDALAAWTALLLKP